MVDIQPAVIAVTYLRDFTRWVRGLQKDADVLTRTNAAEEKVAEVYDKLQELRGENLALLEANQQLTSKLRDSETWQATRSHYKLVSAPGGALVYQHDGADGAPAHYVCPVCIEKKLLAPLQDAHLSNGVFGCPSCNKPFSVNPRRPFNPPPPIRGDW